MQVVLFARLRELAGAARIELELERGADAADCFGRLADERPALAPLRDALLVAVNDRYASWDHRLADGDEVVFLPPVSGG